MHHWEGFGGVTIAGDSWGDPNGPLVLTQFVTAPAGATVARVRLLGLHHTWTSANGANSISPSSRSSLRSIAPRPR